MDSHAHADWAFQVAPVSGETSNVAAIGRLGFLPAGNERTYRRRPPSTYLMP